MQHRQRQHRARCIGQHMPQQDVPARTTQQERRFDERGLPRLDDLCAHHPGEDGHRGDAGRDRGVLGVEAERGDDDDGQQEVRDRQQHVDQAGQHDVDPAAEETRQQADQAAGDDTDDHGDECARHRRGRAIDDAGVEIAAQMVGAEPVAAARAEQLVGGDADERIVAREQAWRDRPGDHEGNDSKRDRDGHRQAESRQPADRRGARDGGGGGNGHHVTACVGVAALSSAVVGRDLAPPKSFTRGSSSG